MKLRAVYLSDLERSVAREAIAQLLAGENNLTEREANAADSASAKLAAKPPTAAQMHQLWLLSQVGVSRHIPRRTAAALIHLGLIEWDGPTSSGDGMQAGGYMLTDAGKAALTPGVVGINGLTESETSATASVMGIVGAAGVGGLDGR